MNHKLPEADKFLIKELIKNEIKDNVSIEVQKEYYLDYITIILRYGEEEIDSHRVWLSDLKEGSYNDS